MDNITKLKKLIRIYWYIIGGLALFFVYNCNQYVNYTYAYPEMRCSVVVADDNNYVRFINFSVRDDSTIIFHSSGTAYRHIYTGKDDHVSADNYTFEHRGELDYYAIDEEKVYSAHIPLQISKEIREVLVKRRNADKEIQHFFTIHPKGLIELQVKEVGNGKRYYDEDILLYETTYQAHGYLPDSMLEELDEALYINYSALLPNLLKKKYNWSVRFTGSDKISDEMRDKVRAHDIATDFLGQKWVYELSVYGDSTKFYLNDLKIGKEYITFDVPVMDEIFDELYSDSSPSEKSYIEVELSDSMKVKSIQVFKDTDKRKLPYKVIN